MNEQNNYNQENIKAPNISGVMQRLNKRETIPVAFRIDELTYAALDLFAKAQQVTVSALENAINDAFVAEHVVKEYSNFNDEQCRRNALNLYLERNATKLAKMSEAELIEEYQSDFVEMLYRDMKMPLPPKTQRQEIYRTFMTEILPKRRLAYVEGMHDFFDVRVFVNFMEDSWLDNHEYERARMLEDDKMDEYDESVDFELFVAIDKWPVVMALLSDYERKFEQLFGRDAKHGVIYHTGGTTEEDFDDVQNLEVIAKIIDKYSGKELVNELTNILKMPTYVSERKCL